MIITISRPYFTYSQPKEIVQSSPIFLGTTRDGLSVLVVVIVSKTEKGKNKTGKKKNEKRNERKEKAMKKWKKGKRITGEGS